MVDNIKQTLFTIKLQVQMKNSNLFLDKLKVEPKWYQTIRRIQKQGLSDAFLLKGSWQSPGYDSEQLLKVIKNIMHAACQLVTMIKHSNESKACSWHMSHQEFSNARFFFKTKTVKPAKTRACTAAARHRTYSFARSPRWTRLSVCCHPRGFFLSPNTRHESINITNKQ